MSTKLYLLEHKEYGYYSNAFYQEFGGEWVEDPAHAQMFSDLDDANYCLESLEEYRADTGEDFEVVEFKLLRIR